MRERLVVPSRKVVIKYGGDTLADATRIDQAARYAADVHGQGRYRATYVASAERGETPAWKELMAAAAAGEKKELRDARLIERRNRHLQQIDTLQLDPQRAQHAKRAVGRVVDAVHAHLDGITNISPSDQAYVYAAGERMVVPLLVARMEQLGVPSVAVDSRNVIATTHDRLNAQIVFDATRQQTQHTLIPLLEDGYVPVMTGYLGSSNPERMIEDIADFGVAGQTNLVGSGGSDYVATGTAAAIEARRALLMKGPMRGAVAGVFTADPRVHDDAQIRPVMSYGEAIGFDGQVLHPRAAEPLQDAGIPLWVLSLSAKDRQPHEPPGTVICNFSQRPREREVGRMAA